MKLSPSITWITVGLAISLAAAGPGDAAPPASIAANSAGVSARESPNGSFGLHIS
jgi:hypothetical protein